MEQNVNGKKRIGIMVKGLSPFYLFYLFYPYPYYIMNDAY